MSGVGDTFLRPCSRCGGWPSVHLWVNDEPLCAWCGTGQEQPKEDTNDYKRDAVSRYEKN